MANAVEAICDRTQAPEQIAFQAVLTQASLVVQAFADVETLSGSSPTSTFLMTIAESSERKSTCDRLASLPIRRVHDERVAEYELQRKRFFARQQSRKGADDVHALIEGADGEAEETPGDPPVSPAILLSDTTTEGLFAHFDQGNPSVGIVSDDAGQFFGGHSMRRENKLMTAATLSRVWDGQAPDRHRASSEFRSYPGRRVTFGMMLQPEVAKEILSDPVLADQGFLSRVLTAFPPSRIGSRTIDDPDKYYALMQAAEGRLAPFYARIKALLAVPLPVDPRDPLALRPRILRLSEDARARLVGYYNGVERGQERDGPFEHIRGFASKIPEQACRIAGILTLFTDHEAEEVSLDTMDEAIEIADWYLLEMQRLRASGWADPEMRAADRLREWLVTYHSRGKISCRTLVREGPAIANDARTVKRLMAILEEFSWVRKLDKGETVNGVRAKDAWEVLV